MENCLNCNKILSYEKRNNKFCDSSCAATYNNKKRKGKYTYKLSEEGLKNIVNSNKTQKRTIKPTEPKYCKNCHLEFFSDKKVKFCSKECKKKSLKENYSIETKKKLSESLKSFYETDEGKKNKEKLRKLGKLRTFSDETRKKLSEKSKEKCKDLNERLRLKEIGRKGGFGKKGVTEGGTKYQSKFEEKCFDFLEKNSIVFEPHKNLPDSSKVTDIYIPHKDIWIELDGINREKKKKYLGKDYDYWLEKLEQYKNKELNYIILYSYEEFIEFIRL